MGNYERHDTAKLSGTGVTKVLRAGHKAISEIKGLRRMVLRAVFLNYLIFLVATFLLNFLFFYFLLNPIINFIFGRSEGFMAIIGTMILWSIQLTVASVIAFAALRFSVSLVNLWHQGLVEKVISHFRGIEERTFSLKIWITEVKYIFKEAFKAFSLPIILFFIGFIPFVGLLIIFILESHLLGKECIIVYTDCLNDFDEASELRRKLRWLPLRIGWLPAVLSFIPFLGWMFLPLSQTYQVIGFAFLAENSRKN